MRELNNVSDVIIPLIAKMKATFCPVSDVAFSYDRMTKGATFIRNMSHNFYGCNFLESYGEVCLDLLGPEAITRLV
jgi:hypothetical protein